MLTPAQEQAILQQAFQLHQQNRLAEAEVLYRQILAANPLQPQALFLFGVMASQVGQYEVAEHLLSASLKVAPNNLDAYLNLADAYQQQQKFTEAENSLEQALKLNAAIAEIWFNQGNLFDVQGKHERALESFRRAITLKPAWPDPYVHLGLSHKALERYDEALAAFQQALERNPQHYQALYNLANLLQQLKRYDEARAYSEKALAIFPSAEIYSQMGSGYAEQGKWDEALPHYLKAIELKPQDVGMLNNLGNAYKEIGNFPEAEKIYQQALALAPDVAQTHFNLGCLYQEKQQPEKAIAEYKKTLELDPRFVYALLNLAVISKSQNRLAEALEYNKEALEIAPNYADVYANIANIYQDQGQIAEAIAHYKKAFTVEPDHAAAHSNYLFAMHYDMHSTPQEIYKETLEWARRHAEAVPHRKHTNDPDPERRLRIGYVSADLRKHPVTSYIEPVLKSHDKSQVEVFCYASQLKDDEVTERLRSYADHWLNIVRLSDEAVAERIQQDKIDILIDLSGHTAGNRLRMFARKPAPLQATWIGYFNTVGMKAMDYIITDRFLLPADEEHLYVEKPLRLPHSGAVFAVHDLPVEVNALPALANGYVTFGCFNALSKITPEVIRIWSEILAKVPDAKLYLKNKSFGDPDLCEQYRGYFGQHGVAPERLKFSGSSPLAEYLACYNDVDIGLDPFPYNGGTTTLDSLWMGVPMVVLKGDRLVAHIGESLQGAVGLEEFTAATKAEYVEKAVAFAANTQRLSDIRRTLRQTLAAAPSTNPAIFTRGLEIAFRDIWKEWCRTRA